MIKLFESNNESKINKLITIIKSNGTMSDKGNYVIEGRQLTAYYNPTKNSVVCMDPVWGYPRYINDSTGLYKLNIANKRASLTLATLIKNVLDQIKVGSKIDDYDDEGNLITQ